ncbi:hypothetical protein GS504_01875 [Rhodococcus hoagii]|nr:hypothetical protein [Prescottella equi]NKS72227.1 hypothetical protein [Prescottella equi]
MPRAHDPDRGASATATGKRGEMLDDEEKAERDATREGLRDLDRMVDESDLHWRTKDAERALPKDRTEGNINERKVKPLPSATDVRKPLSSRQQKDRNKSKVAALTKMPRTQQEALVDHYASGVDGARRMNDLNDRLYVAVGDKTELSEADRKTVERLDRAIEAAERNNDRGHVVYMHAEFPKSVNQGNLEGFLDNHFSPGTAVDFDRYSFGTQNIHELGHNQHGKVDVVYEVQTARGMYLGGSDSSNSAHHALPRGMNLETVGWHEATYTDKNGNTGRRIVVQLTDRT